jgi:hypothetical protein
MPHTSSACPRRCTATVGALRANPGFPAPHKPDCAKLRKLDDPPHTSTRTVRTDLRPSRWSVMHRSGGVENACTRMRGKSPRALRGVRRVPCKRGRKHDAPTAVQACIAAHSFARGHWRRIRSGCGRVTSTVRCGRNDRRHLATRRRPRPGGGNECGAKHSLRAAWCCAPRRAHGGGRPQWSSSSSSSA